MGRKKKTTTTIIKRKKVVSSYFLEIPNVVGNMSYCLAKYKYKVTQEENIRQQQQ